MPLKGGGGLWPGLLRKKSTFLFTLKKVQLATKLEVLEGDGIKALVAWQIREVVFFCRFLISSTPKFTNKYHSF